MNEQSHKDEMRAALRGDFERLRARAEPGTARESVSIPSTQIAAGDTGGPVAAQPVAAQADASPRSWLGRLRDRRPPDVR